MATYYFPNYPYNDLREDPFLLAQSNAYNSECNTYTVQTTTNGVYEYTDCFTKTLKGEPILAGTVVTVCSLTVPTVTDGGTVTVTEIGYDTYALTSQSKTRFKYTDPDNIVKYIIAYSTDSKTINVKISTKPTRVAYDTRYTVSLQPFAKNEACYPSRLKAFESEDSKYRQVFNSPETSFGQPFLGTFIKLENVLFGVGKAHFTEVKKNAMYRLLSKEAQEDALSSSGDLGNVTVEFNATAMFTAYQAYIEIYTNGITRRNYGYSYNSIVDYNYYAAIPNNGNKQREIENTQYLTSGVQSVGESINFNNFQRESSVYIKTSGTKTSIPFPKDTETLVQGGVNVIEDKSRYVNSQVDCSQPEQEFDISSVVYYASLKNHFPNQWGQIYSYETIDTGYQVLFDEPTPKTTIFGGDTFIGKFGFKTKLPFFIDNRVGAPNDSDVFYDELGNIAYPEYWHSSRNLLFDYKYPGQPKQTNIISVKAHNFDCPNNQLPKPDSEETPNPITNPDRTFYDGKVYMFAYGIPYFYCESSINLDLRQAFNNKEGDFYPHVSTGIPDDWVQESNVSIINDNTYYYNLTYSKQNKENYFSHLPIDWEDQLCYTHYPFRAIFSDPQLSYSDNRVNSWLIYKPAAFFDFPQNYGKLVSLDGIQNKQVLARFENKSLLYNALYTTQTNTGGQVYLGQSIFSSNVPPLDFSETDLGYVGSQHKFLLKIPQGQITVDAKRGQVFLLSDNKVNDLSAYGSGLNRFFTDHLSFEILRYFPEADIDNHFKGIGLHGVYDSKFDRVIISKLDYIPLSNSIKYDSIEKEFYIETLYNEFPVRTIVSVYDEEYFCNKSWTVSLNLNTKTWASFHSYIPNFYIGENNFFYSGINSSCELEAIAASLLPIPTTTTTTSTSTTSTTSTSTTSTSSTSTTSTSTSSTTTTSTTALPCPEGPYIYYLADEYVCSTCSPINSGVAVCFPITDTPIIGRYYVSCLDNNRVYRLTSTSFEVISIILIDNPYTNCSEAPCVS